MFVLRLRHTSLSSGGGVKVCQDPESPSEYSSIEGWAVGQRFRRITTVRIKWREIFHWPFALQPGSQKRLERQTSSCSAPYTGFLSNTVHCTLELPSFCQLSLPCMVTFGWNLSGRFGLSSQEKRGKTFCSSSGEELERWATFTSSLPAA